MSEDHGMIRGYLIPADVAANQYAVAPKWSAADPDARRGTPALLCLLPECNGQRGVVWQADPWETMIPFSHVLRAFAKHQAEWHA